MTVNCNGFISFWGEVVYNCYVFILFTPYCVKTFLISIILMLSIYYIQLVLVKGNLKKLSPASGYFVMMSYVQSLCLVAVESIAFCTFVHLSNLVLQEYGCTSRGMRDAQVIEYNGYT